MAGKTYTLIVVPDNHGQVRRFRFDFKWLKALSAVLAAVVLLQGAAFFHYAHVVGEARENPALREENLALRSDLAAMTDQAKHIAATLDRVGQFDQKLRAITLLSDPQRNLAMGPTEEPAPGEPAKAGENPFVRTDVPASTQVLKGKIDELSAEATRQEESLQELHAYFQNQRALLASTPSIWPARGWVTSDFGARLDPYTGDRVMHAGLDIAGEHGREIRCPADGTVVFSGLEGGYGNVLVVDHGYGIKTRYGHLSMIRVGLGDKIARGQLIANMGNTGRSTGPHLHYEVRVNGIAQNPRKFILED